MNTIIDTPESIPFWRSKVIMGALVSFAFKLAAWSGLAEDLSADAVLIDSIAVLISFVADAVIVGARVSQKAAPAITVTK